MGILLGNPSWHPINHILVWVLYRNNDSQITMRSQVKSFHFSWFLFLFTVRFKNIWASIVHWDTTGGWSQETPGNFLGKQICFTVILIADPSVLLLPVFGDLFLSLKVRDAVSKPRGDMETVRTQQHCHCWQGKRNCGTGKGPKPWSLALL